MRLSQGERLKQGFTVIDDRSSMATFGDYLDTGWYGWLYLHYPNSDGDPVYHHTTATGTYYDQGNQHLTLADPYFGAMDCVAQDLVMDCRYGTNQRIEYTIDGKFRVKPPGGT